MSSFARFCRSLRKIAKSDYQLRHVSPSAWKNSALTCRILMKLDILAFCPKIFLENSSSVKIWQEWWVLYMKTFSHLWQYLAEFFLEWEMFEVNVLEKIKRHILRSVTFFLKSCLLWNKVEKCGGAREAADDNMARTRCMLDNEGYTLASTPLHTHAHTHRNMYFAFPLQEWFRERASFISYTYISCLVSLLTSLWYIMVVTS